MISLENHQFSDFCGFYKGFGELWTPRMSQYLDAPFSGYNKARDRRGDFMLQCFDRTLQSIHFTF